MRRNVLSVPSLLNGLLSWKGIKFAGVLLFCISWSDNMGFTFHCIYTVFSVNWFLQDKSILHSWNNFQLVKIYNLDATRFNLLVIFFNDFHWFCGFFHVLFSHIYFFEKRRPCRSVWPQTWDLPDPTSLETELKVWAVWLALLWSLSICLSVALNSVSFPLKCQHQQRISGSEWV